MSRQSQARAKAEARAAAKAEADRQRQIEYYQGRGFSDIRGSIRPGSSVPMPNEGVPAVGTPWKDPYGQVSDEPSTGSGDTSNKEFNLEKSERIGSSPKISEILRYPYEQIDGATDYLRIGIVEYKPIGKELVGREQSRRQKTAGKDRIATILLPVPSNIQDNNAVSYSDDSLNALAGALASGSISTMEGLGKAIMGDKDALKNLQDQLEKTIGNSGITLGQARTLITKQLAASAAGVFGGNVSFNQIQARSEGRIFNPNMELLFNGPTLRSFRFSFKMTPRSEVESERIKKIIRTIKRNMAPQTVTTGGSQNLFLKSPNVFELTYMQGNQPHSFLHNFKQCFLESMSVNYTGDGTYATYGDGTPVSMIMDLTFKELEPIYDTDYDGTGPIADGDLYTPIPGGVGY